MSLAYLAERDLAERGEREWLWFEERVYTNRGLHDASCRLARALRALDIGTDDRVIVMMSNCPEVLISYPAVWRIGGVAIPVLNVLDANELAYIVKDSGAKAIICSSDLAGKVTSALTQAERPDVHRILVKDGAESPSQEGWLDFQQLVDENEPLEEAVARGGDDLAVILYTSGTTGRPKGVMQTHRNLAANAEQSWATAKTHDPSEVNLVALPLAHAFGLSVLISSYLFGTRAVLMRRFLPRDALALIQRYRANIMYGVPTMFMYMLAVPERFDTSSMRMWVVGAAAMLPEQIQRFESRFGGTVYVGYGLTEASPSVAVDREFEPRKPGSTGKPLEGVRVKIVDAAGREQPRGQIGEICAAGENICKGYLDMPEATAETFRDGWLHTGDLGYVDEDGYLFVVDRKKDLIIRGGLNVYPKDVEEVLYTHPAVRECAVVGIPDPELGERVCACVVLHQPGAASAEQLIEHCQARLAKYKTPSRIEFLEALPRTAIGKVLKKELRKQLAAKLSRERTEGAQQLPAYPSAE